MITIIEVHFTDNYNPRTPIYRLLQCLWSSLPMLTIFESSLTIATNLELRFNDKYNHQGLV